MAFLAAHIIHLIFIVIWIGGLAFITINVFPALIKTPDPLEKAIQFQRIEHKFAPLARIYMVIVGLSGFYMTYSMGWQGLLFTKAGLPLTIMVVVWVFWFIMLFGLEPLVIKKMLQRMKNNDPDLDIDKIFIKMNKMHWVLLAVSLFTVIMGAVFSHQT